ncbi:S8 family serine peptidase [Roseibium algae]|uniref:S8 family serine peptidase n=1 Tax=Roseibium algae TaxID=3123038 RepID=A0ABU8TS27_9HYPH
MLSSYSLSYRFTIVIILWTVLKFPLSQAAAEDASAGLFPKTDLLPNEVLLQSEAYPKLRQVKALALKLRPKTIRLGSEIKNLDDVVRIHCGPLYNSREKNFLKQTILGFNPNWANNNGNSPGEFSDGLQLSIPFCIKTGSAKIVASDGDTLWSIAKNNYVYSGRKTLQHIADSNPFCEGMSADFCSRHLLKAGQVVLLPYHTYATRGVLRPHVTVSSLAEAFNVRSRNHVEIGIVEPLRLEAGETSEQSCGPRHLQMGSWPFDKKSLLIANAIAKEVNSSRVGSQAGSIVVVDTGMRRSALTALVGNEMVHFDQDGEIGVGIENGAVVAGDESLQSLIQDEIDLSSVTRLHGTKVASVALGFPVFGEKFAEQRAIRMGFARITEVSETDVQKQVIDDRRNITAIMRWVTQESRPNIVNLSLSHEDEDDDFKTIYGTLPDNLSILLVVPSGNLDGRVEDIQRFPAFYQLQNMLVVGAHNRYGDVLPSTTYSAEYVDILAPGCQIVATTNLSASELEEVHGTSYAAPLASFTAGLVKQAGFLGDSRKLRSRIIAATDFDPSLGDQVKYSGRLNPAKAVLFNLDVLEVEMENTTKYLLAGNLRESKSILSNICNDERISSRLKIRNRVIKKANIFKDDSGNIRVRYLVGNRAGTRINEFDETCSLKPDARVTLKNFRVVHPNDLKMTIDTLQEIDSIEFSDDKKSISVPAHMIVDIIPANSTN